MSDAELDREYKPSGRPTSTMAKSFSLALNDLFKIDNSLADLDAAVSEKKKAVSTQASELEALEARIKATEERLRQAATAGPQLSGRANPRQRAPLADTFAQKGYPTSPLSAEFRQEKGYPVGGDLPPTPGASEDGDVPRQK
ncbi:uncharacterized protein L3040_006860 [Drepanopeziza brunnea f. sp. 'multigermtubi']|uniref:uncharacterized protein n=1 Tax=Drepanopeziza brunnea f. sp. 'multigermtubi' TaxID=698441 RepID=UPI0023889F40|nr:hypothetical protein L3040_006860 [Drepanopeziza brunnea f. sp. 'multigermtubi']